MITVGIDLGLNGAIAMLDRQGKIMEYEKLKIRSHNGVKELNGEWLADVLDEVMEHDQAPFVCFEEVGFHFRSSRALRSVSIASGIVVGVCDALEMPYKRVQPTKWQRSMLGKTPKGKTKEKALEMARGYWPDDRFLPTKRSKVPHDGIVDACLIGMYALTHLR